MTDLEPQPPSAELVPAANALQAPAARLLSAVRKRHETLAALLARGPAALSDADLVHDLRVASRRLGEAARLLQPFLEKPTAKAVAASLRALRRAMGDLRDDDVTRQHLLKWRMPAPLRQIAAEIAGNLESARPALVSAAQIQMTSASLTGTMVILARVLEDRAVPEMMAQTERQLGTTLQGLIKAREKQLRRSFGQAAKKQTAASLHAARIEVKKLRYLLELAADAAAVRGAKKKIHFLRRLQELLGDHHDLHVITEQLAGRLKVAREKPIRNLHTTWRKWHRHMNTVQSKRAAVFFARTYAWING
jgi:CHAD domain-containing protein